MIFMSFCALINEESTQCICGVNLDLNINTTEYQSFHDYGDRHTTSSCINTRHYRKGLWVIYSPMFREAAALAENTRERQNISSPTDYCIT